MGKDIVKRAEDLLKQVDITTTLVDSMTADAKDQDEAFKEFEKLIGPAISLSFVTPQIARAIYHKAFHDGYKYGVKVTREIERPLVEALNAPSVELKWYAVFREDDDERTPARWFPDYELAESAALRRAKKYHLRYCISGPCPNNTEADLQECRMCITVDENTEPASVKK